MSNRSNQRRTQTTDPYTIPNEIPYNYLQKSIGETELSCDNYLSWKVNMLYLLDINNLIDYVIEEKIVKIKVKDITNVDNYITDKLDNTLAYDKTINTKDIKNDNLTKYIIMNSLGKNTRKIIESRGRTAYQAWKILENSFTKSKEQLKTELKLKLENLKFHPNIDINIFIASMENIIEQLDNIDTPLTDNIKVGILNRSLPEFLRFINVFQHRDNWTECKNYTLKVIPDIIYSHIKENKMSINENTKPITSDSITHDKTIPTNNKIKNRKNGRCYICKKYGHYANRCPFNKKYKNSKKSIYKGNHKKYYKNFKNRAFHNKRYINNKNKQISYIEANKEDNLNYKEEYLETFTTDYNSNFENKADNIEDAINNQNHNYNNNNSISIWTIDSGASMHITHQFNTLHNVKPHYEIVTFANGDKVQSTYIGDFEGYINNTKISLKNVLFIPEFKRNLISIGNLLQQNYKISFQQKQNKSTATIYNYKGKPIVNIKDNTNTNTFKLWILKNKIINTPKLNQTNFCHIPKTIRDRKDILLWHRRFGHLDINLLKDKLPYISIKDKCQICAKSKLRNAPFKV